MTTIYSTNFDADTAGNLPAGWANKVGTWAVRTSNSVSAPNSLASTTNADGDVVLYTGASAAADMGVSFTMKQTITATVPPLMGLVLRSDAANSNNYTIVFGGATSGQVAAILFKKVSGTYSQITTNAFALSQAVGDTIYIRATIVGSTISLYVGNGSFPSTPSTTFTDTSITAAGYPGLYNGKNNNTVSMSIDDFVLDDTVATAPVNNAFNGNSGVLFSPYTWDISASAAKTINAGAYFRTIFGGTTCALKFDMTGIASPVPQLSYRVDRFGPWINVPLAASITITIPSDTSDYANKPGHLLEVVVKSTTETQARWSTQSTAVKLTGIVLDTGKTLTAPPALPLRAMFYGDSITEGVRTVNMTATNDTDRNDASQGWAYTAAQMLGAEAAIIGFGASGFIATGSGGVPPLPTSYNLLYAGVARSFSPQPDFIVLMEGTNDGGDVTSPATAVLNSLLAATTTTKIIVLRPFNGTAHAGQLQAAVAACSTPARVTYVDTAGWFTTANSSDSLHPYGVENVTHIAPLAAAAIRSVIGAGTSVANSIYVANGRLKRSIDGSTATPGKRLRIA